MYILNYDTTGNKMAGYTIVFSAGPIGSIIAPAIGGKVIASYGKETFYFIIFILYLLSSSCTLLLSRQPAKGKLEKSIKYHHASILVKNKMLDAMVSLKQISGMIVLLTILVSAQNIGEYFITLYAGEARSFSIEHIGVASTALYIGSTIFTFLLGRSENKVKPHTALIAGSIIFITSVLLLTFGNNTIFSLVSAFFLRGTGPSILLFSQAILAKSITDESNKGFILSVYIAIRSIVIGLITYPGAFLYHINPAYPFYAEAVIIVVCIAATVYSSRLIGQLCKYTTSS